MLLATPRRPRSTLFGIFALWVIFYASFTLFTPPLLDDADSVHAEVAREMLLRHDYVTLYANGIRYLEKAPLLYWAMAASFKVFGVSTAAARIPLALTVLALALTLEAFARRAFRSARAGLYAALILLSSFGIFIFTRITIPDAMVCLWLTVAMYAFWRTEEPDCDARELRIASYAFAAACALNVLTKGLIGIVFPIGIVVLYLLLTRGLSGAFQRLRQLHPLSGVLVFLAVAAPWHILIALANPTQGHPGGLSFAGWNLSVPLPTDGNVHGWLWFYFVNEQLLRYVNLRVPRDYDTVPLWLFWGLCVVWLMPWSAFLLKAFGNAIPIRSAQWRQRFQQQTLPPKRRMLLLAAVWTALPLVFFSLSTRQEYYVLPALPGMTILVAEWLAGEEDYRQKWGVRSPSYSLFRWKFASRAEKATGQTRNPHRSADRIVTLLLLLGFLFAVFSASVLFHGDASAGNVDLASLLQQNPGDYALSMGHFLDLNANALGLFRLPLVLASVSLVAAPLAAFVLRSRQREHAANLALAAGAFGFLVAAHLGLRTFAPVLTSAQLAQAIAQQLHPQDLIVIHGEYEAASTLGFYLRRNDLHILEGRSSNLWYGSFFPDAPAIFETPQSIAQKWAGPKRIFLWQSLANDPGPLPALPGNIYVIAKSGGKEIVSNQP